MNHWSCQLCYTVQNCGLWLSHKRLSWMPHTTSFNDDSWVLHGKTKCTIYEIRRNYKEWTSSLRKEDWDGWDMCCAWKTTGYQSKPHGGKWTHAPEEPEGRDQIGLTPYLEIWSQLAWHGKMQSKQQSTEKTGVDVWPNVSLTRAELRSKVISDYSLSDCN